MSTTEPAFDRCVICSGTREEHGDQTRHVFTLVPGDLRLPPKTVERQPMKQPDSAMMVVSRLVEILLDKGVLETPEALMCFGIQLAVPEEVPGARPTEHNSGNQGRSA